MSYIEFACFVICCRSWWPWNTFTVRTLCTVTSNQRMSF